MASTLPSPVPHLSRKESEVSDFDCEFFDAETGIESYSNHSANSLPPSPVNVDIEREEHIGSSSQISSFSQSHAPNIVGPDAELQPCYDSESSRNKDSQAFSDISGDNSSEDNTSIGSSSRHGEQRSQGVEGSVENEKGSSRQDVSRKRENSDLSESSLQVSYRPQSKDNSPAGSGDGTSTSSQKDLLIPFEKIKAPSPSLHVYNKKDAGPFTIFRRMLGLSEGGLPIVTNDNLRVKTTKKAAPDFAGLTLTQTHQKHHAKIWTMKFSHDGAFLASGDSDGVINVWSVGLPPVDFYEDELYGGEENGWYRKAKEREAFRRLNIPDTSTGASQSSSRGFSSIGGEQAGGDTGTDQKFKLLHDTPYKTLRGHMKDVVDLSWSPQETKMLLSASVDRTVRLWFIARDTYLVFRHPDIVSCVDFYPGLDIPLLFVSGCMDQKIRIWTVPKDDIHPVREYDEPKDMVNTPEYVTSISFVPDGRMVAAGLTKSQLIFFTYEGKGLRFFTQMDLRNRSGKYRSGRNVTGIRFFKPHTLSSTQEGGAVPAGNSGLSRAGEMLVSINDSRIRLCDLDDYSVISKVKGAQNESMQIKASLSDDGKYIISGSETGAVYIWNRQMPGERVREKVARNELYETFNATAIPGAAAVVAIFAPEAAVKKATQINNGAFILDYIPNLCARIIVTASEGDIHVYSRGLAPEHSEFS